MASHTPRIVPCYSFQEANSLPLQDRFRLCIKQAKKIVLENGYQDLRDYPCVPEKGATEAELHDLETQLSTVLPLEYREFLAMCRYLKLDDGREIGGFDHDGLYVAEKPWVWRRHQEGATYLVFANYWRYADGDQLMLDLTQSAKPVIAYLHEHGPLFEPYAPSFSLALWRLIHEPNPAE